jgi:hypothetical protein
MGDEQPVIFRFYITGGIFIQVCHSNNFGIYLLKCVALNHLY